MQLFSCANLFAIIFAGAKCRDVLTVAGGGDNDAKRANLLLAIICFSAHVISYKVFMLLNILNCVSNTDKLNPWAVLGNK